MKSWLLVAWFMSSGQYTQSFSNYQDCYDVLAEAQIVKGSDLFSGVCIGPDDEVAVSVGSISP